MLNGFSKLKTPAEWGKHQFNATLSSDFSWSYLGEQHFLASKVLLKECWNAKNEYNKLYRNTTGFGYGTNEFEVLQKTYFYEPATLLLALSFESFLKGIWVKQNKEKSLGVDSIPKELATHNLIRLAKKCSLVLTKEEEKMLKLLTIFSEWRGKYNLPKKQEVNIEYWMEKYQIDFLLKKFPGDFDFPEGIKSLRKKISDKLNISLL